MHRVIIAIGDFVLEAGPLMVNVLIYLLVETEGEK